MPDYAIRPPGVDTITPYGMDAQNMISPKTVSGGGTPACRSSRRSAVST